MPIDSPLGRLWLTASSRGLCALSWLAPPVEANGPGWEEGRAWLVDYFAGVWRPLPGPLDLQVGSPYQQRVWRHLTTLVPGQVVTYGELARMLDSGARAVGQAVAANPLPILVPCHRVVGQYGLGGYSGAGGLATKRWLLAHENAKIPGG